MVRTQENVCKQNFILKRIFLMLRHWPCQSLASPRSPINFQFEVRIFFIRQFFLSLAKWIVNECVSFCNVQVLSIEHVNKASRKLQKSIIKEMLKKKKKKSSVRAFLIAQHIPLLLTEVLDRFLHNFFLLLVNNL